MIGVEEVFGFIGIGRHRMLRTLLSSYIDGEVSAPEATRLEKHLSECEECRRELETLTATVHLLRELPELEPPRSFAPESVAAPPEVARGYVWVPRLATSLAAGLLVVVLLLGDVSGVLNQSDKAVTATAALDSAAADVPAAAPMPAPAMAAAAAPPPGQPKEEVVVEGEEETEVAAPVPAAASVPAPAMAAAAAPPAAQPETQTVVEDAAPPVQQGEAATPLRREPSPGPQEAPIVAETPPGGPGDGGGVALPLRQLELATGIVLVVLVLVVVWAARRGRRWSP